MRNYHGIQTDDFKRVFTLIIGLNTGSQKNCRDLRLIADGLKLQLECFGTHTLSISVDHNLFNA